MRGRPGDGVKRTKGDVTVWTRKEFEFLIVAPDRFALRKGRALGRTFELNSSMSQDEKQARVNQEADEIEMDIADGREW